MGSGLVHNQGHHHRFDFFRAWSIFLCSVRQDSKAVPWLLGVSVDGLKLFYYSEPVRPRMVSLLINFLLRAVSAIVPACRVRAVPRLFSCFGVPFTSPQVYRWIHIYDLRYNKDKFTIEVVNDSRVSITLSL